MTDGQKEKSTNDVKTVHKELIQAAKERKVDPATLEEPAEKRKYSKDDVIKEAVVEAWLTCVECGEKTRPPWHCVEFMELVDENEEIFFFCHKCKAKEPIPKHCGKDMKLDFTRKEN